MEKEGMQRRLWHYTKLEAGFNILAEEKFRMNNIGKTNDPRESRPWEFLTLLTLRNQVEPAFQKEIDEANDVIRNIIPQIIMEEWKVACFTLDQDLTSLAGETSAPIKQMCHDFLDPGYTHPRMWAQYAEEHKGVCICFEMEKLEDNLRQRFNGQYLSGKVEYDRQKFLTTSLIPPYPTGPFNNILTDIKRLGSKGAAQKYVLDHYQSLFLRKNPDWASETEFRCLVHEPNCQIENISIEESITEIIVGMNFPEFYKTSLIELCNKLNIHAQRVEWPNGLPKLVPFGNN